MKIGDYAYIKGINRDCGIGKITQLNSGYSSNGGELIDIQFKHSEHSIPKKDIISSPNIIDLIEIGDYVNGKKVIDKQYHYTDKDSRDMGLWCIFYENVALGDYQYDIKSIVTKEMFEKMEYKIKKEG